MTNIEQLQEDILKARKKLREEYSKILILLKESTEKMDKYLEELTP